MPKAIKEHKEEIQTAAKRAVKIYNAFVPVHKEICKELATRADKLDRTTRNKNRAAISTSAGVVADLVLTGGCYSLILVSAKIAAAVNYNRLLKAHVEKAKALVEMEQAKILDCFRALKKLEVACENFRALDVRLKHVNTVGIVAIAFSPGSRIVLSEVALHSLKHAIREHPEAALNVTISALEVAIYAIEAVGVEAAINAAEFALQTIDYIPVIGAVNSLYGLVNAVKAGREGGSEQAQEIRAIIELQKQQLFPMQETLKLMHRSFNIGIRQG